MAPRAYNNETRLQQQAELKARIAAAAAALHAEKGVVATTYADVARQAGVSLPTMYSHFPTLETLIGACTAHVAAAAPPFPVEKIMEAPDLLSAAQALVEACDQVHAHFEPWAVWREEQVAPRLADMAAEARRQQLDLVTSVLRRHLGPGDHKERAAVWETLLSFDTWHRLVREHKRSRAAVRAVLLHLLLAVTGPQPAATSNPRPKARKK
jgi:AcrR family transcriptional regulator